MQETQYVTDSPVDHPAYRLNSIDAIRGLAIVVMALGHVRDFFLFDAQQDPMADFDIAVGLFATRWITHFCAPVFVLLAGASAGLMMARKSPAALGGGSAALPVQQPSKASPMSTAEIITPLSPPPCEKSLLFRLTLLLPEIPPRHGLPSAQALQTASPDMLSRLLHAGTAIVLPKRRPRAQQHLQTVLIESP